MIIGGHRDAWGPGAADNVSGTVSVLEAARAVAEAVKCGPSPEADDHLRDVGCGGVGTHRLDGVRRGGFAATRARRGCVPEPGRRRGRGALRCAEARRRCAPSLRDVARMVPDPNGKGSVYSEWQRAARCRGHEHEPPMDDPGGGSDFAGFYNHLGIPIADWGFGGESGVYHSQYDDFAWMTRFGDPDFAYHATAARIGAAMVLRLANADVLPYDYVEFARTMQRYVAPIERALSLTRLERADARAAQRDRAHGARGGELRRGARLGARDQHARARASTRPTPRFATWSVR